MKHSLYIFFIMMLFLKLGSLTALAAPNPAADAAILIYAASGRVLYENNAHERMPQASTTKITTALVALERAKLTKKIRIPDDYVNVGESSIYLEPGEIHTLKDLMYSLMLKSANDAAEAIAIGVGDSVKEFTELMNERVIELGLKNSHYVNPHGLHHEDHYSSAYDLAMIAREALKYEEFREIIVTNRHLLPWAGNEYSRVIYNGNRLLKTYEGADGVKTGYTRQAGSCLVGSATRNGMQLIAVVLNCSGMNDEVTALLDYGFKNYQLVDYFKKGQVIEEIIVEGGKEEKVKVVAKDSLSIALTKKEVLQIQEKLYLPLHLKAPVKKDQRIGVGIISLNNEISLITELTAHTHVEKRSLLSYLWYKFISAII